MDEMQSRQIPDVWDLPDPPPHPEMMVSTVVKPDNIRGGHYLLIASSSAVKLTFSPTGPSVERINKDPTEGGVILVLAYCYPFIAGKIMTGEHRGLKMCIDIRRHQMVRVDQKFVRAILPTPEEKKGRQAQRMPPGMFEALMRSRDPLVPVEIPLEGDEVIQEDIIEDLQQGGWIFPDIDPDDVAPPEDNNNDGSGI